MVQTNLFCAQTASSHCKQHHTRKSSSLYNCWACMFTTFGSWLDSQFRNLFFINERVLKVHSSSTLPCIATMAGSPMFMNSDTWCRSKLDASIQRHKRVSGFKGISPFMLAWQMDFIINFNVDAYTSNLSVDNPWFSIFTCSMVSCSFRCS